MRLRRTLLSAVLLAAVTMLAPVRATAATPIVPRGSWPVYHHDDAHTGFDPSINKVTAITAGWVSPVMDQEVYASPVIYGGLVYAATLNNTVYAFNQIDGSQAWKTHLRSPETGGWSCGNVSPQGILGTPVIDTSGGRIYVATLDITDDLYRVEGLSLTTGAVQMSTVIPASIGLGFDWTIQQERGALAVHNGYVYVPFGGRAGDCGDYSGWVVGVPTDGSGSNPANIKVFQTAPTGNGIWSGGGVVVNDATGEVLVTTGNGVSATAGDGCGGTTNSPSFLNDTVMRLSPTLAQLSYFMPPDWQNHWCYNDMDLGSASAVLINPNLIFTAGKWGTGFLLNATTLGGVGGELFPASSPTYNEADVCLGNTSDATFGSFAYAAPYVYVECNGLGLSAVSVNTGTHTFTPCDAICAGPDWNAGGGATYGPPIVAGGLVFVAEDGGGLVAYDAATGAPFYQSGAFGINHFVTPAEAGGQVFVPSHTVIRSFRLYTGINPVLPGPVPPRPSPIQVPSAPPGPRNGVPGSNPNPPPVR